MRCASPHRSVVCVCLSFPVDLHAADEQGCHDRLLRQRYTHIVSALVMGLANSMPLLRIYFFFNTHYFSQLKTPSSEHFSTTQTLSFSTNRTSVTATAHRPTLLRTPPSGPRPKVGFSGVRPAPLSVQACRSNESFFCLFHLRYLLTAIPLFPQEIDAGCSGDLCPIFETAGGSHHHENPTRNPNVDLATRRIVSSHMLPLLLTRRVCA